MLSLWRRHESKCPHKRKGRSFIKCQCPIWCDGELFDKRVRQSLDTRDWARAGVLGGAVGLVSGLLYVASQLVGAPEILDSDDAAGVRRLLFFVLPIGFVAGLTFDAVYARLRGAEVSGVETLRKM